MNNRLFISGLCAISITFILFFVDEGYYNFQWMQNIGNWVVFVVYVAAIGSIYAAGTYLLERLFPGFALPKPTGALETLTTIIGGTVVGTVGMLVFFIVA